MQRPKNVRPMLPARRLNPVIGRKPNANADAFRFWGELSTDSILSLTDSARSLAGNTPQCFTVLRLKLRHTNRETESLIGQKILHPF
jgi:hypothetical protein